MIQEAAGTLRRWREQPQIMVRELFGVIPDPWQDEVLGDFPHNQRQAMAACKGPGKTATMAWLAWNFLLTRPHPMVAATSITGDNLATCLWTEMARWHAKAPLLQSAFHLGAERIFSRDHPKTWYMVARTWPKSANREDQANTLAGLHSDYLLFLLDESGGIPDAVMVAADAALGTGVETHIIQAGNTTHLEGPLYRAATLEAKMWKLYRITGDPDDPKRASRVSIKWAREMIERWGRNHPYVLVNVFGQFPPGSLNTLIGPDQMAEAMKRMYREYEIGNAPKVLGIDVARFGDDASVIFPRQGIQAFAPLEYRNIDSTIGAGATSRKWADWDADAAFIDNTGGFGSGWIDQLHLIGRAPIGVGFAEMAHESTRYANKRAEMYFDAVEWIKRGGALPSCPELTAAMTQTTYTFDRGGDRLILEPKDFVKSKLGYSPDHADAFVLTFAEPVSPRNARRGTPRHQFEYDPFAERGRGQHRSDYEPFAN